MSRQDFGESAGNRNPKSELIKQFDQENFMPLVRDLEGLQGLMDDTFSQKLAIAKAAIEGDDSAGTEAAVRMLGKLAEEAQQAMDMSMNKEISESDARIEKLKADIKQGETRLQKLEEKRRKLLSGNDK